MDVKKAVFEVSQASFQQDVVERSKDEPVVLLFWTDQIAPAADTKRILENLTAQYQGKFALALSDVAQDQVVAQQLRIQGIPSIRVIDKGQIVEQLDGPQGEAVLRQFIERMTMSSGELLQTSLAEAIDSGDWDSALSMLQQALNEEPNNPMFKVEWADVLICKGEPEEARKVLDTIPEELEEKKRPATRLELAEEAAAMRPVSELELRVREQPNDLDIRYELGVQFAIARKYENSLEHLMHILQSDRSFRDDIGRTSMVRVMILMNKDSPVAKRYRRRMFNFMH